MELREKGSDNPNIIIDRVGEETDLLLCPVCDAHLDCFANIDGHCTALNIANSGSSCSFYKNVDSNLKEAKKCYQRLKDQGREDLVRKYVKPLSTLGVMDGEIEAAEHFGEIFDRFRESDYQDQLDKAINDVLYDDLFEDLNDDSYDDSFGDSFDDSDDDSNFV